MAVNSWTALGSPRVERAFLDDPLLGPVVRPILFGTAAGPTNYTADVAEAVTLSEALATLAAFAAGASETVTLSDAIAALQAAVVGLAEAPGLTEAIAAAIASGALHLSDVFRVGLTDDRLAVDLGSARLAVSLVPTTVPELDLVDGRLTCRLEED